MINYSEIESFLNYFLITLFNFVSRKIMKRIRNSTVNFSYSVSTLHAYRLSSFCTEIVHMTHFTALLSFSLCLLFSLSFQLSSRSSSFHNIIPPPLIFSILTIPYSPPPSPPPPCSNLAIFPRTRSLLNPHRRILLSV